MKILRLAALLVFLGGISAHAQSTLAPAPATKPAPAQKAWFIRLIPPRTTFPQDMTPDEEKLMTDHFVYWKGQFDKGVCLFGGPVMDPRGAYGVLAIVASTQQEAEAIASADPSVKGGVNHIEVAEMRIAFLQKAH